MRLSMGGDGRFLVVSSRRFLRDIHLLRCYLFLLRILCLLLCRAILFCIRRLLRRRELVLNPLVLLPWLLCLLWSVLRRAIYRRSVLVLFEFLGLVFLLSILVFLFVLLRLGRNRILCLRSLVLSSRRALLIRKELCLIGYCGIFPWVFLVNVVFKDCCDWLVGFK